jgi:hypothetical protein
MSRIKFILKLVVTYLFTLFILCLTFIFQNAIPLQLFSGDISECQLQGTVESIECKMTGGHAIYKFSVKGYDGFFTASSTLNEELIYTKAGDKINITYTEVNNITNTVGFFSNENINKTDIENQVVNQVNKNISEANVNKVRDVVIDGSVEIKKPELDENIKDAVIDENVKVKKLEPNDISLTETQQENY